MKRAEQDLAVFSLSPLLHGRVLFFSIFVAVEGIFFLKVFGRECRLWVK
jgi:hypothetical protein